MSQPIRRLLYKDVMGYVRTSAG